jgi:hypothetical protein
MTIIRNLAIVLALLALAGPAAAQAPDAAARATEIDRAVAKALLERGKVLYASGDHANAKMLFIESLERSADGPSAEDSLAMLRAANERLGFDDLDDGNPIGKPVGNGGEGPVDPYGTGDGGEGPVDPYGNQGGEGPVDPYGTGGGGGSVPPPGGEVDQPDPSTARRAVTLFGAGYGALLGLAVAGPQDEIGDTRGAAVLLAALGAGAGAGGAWYLMRNRELTPGQGSAIASGGAWGTYTVALFGDAVTGVDSTTTNEGFKSAAIGGALGLGAGTLFAVKVDPSEGDMSLINSFGAYGTTTGLMFGLLMAPPESEAYSINGMLGAFAGLGVGYYVSTKAEVSRRRMLRVDLGALAGLAATWAVFYPLVEDGGTNNDEQAAGAISIGAMAAGGYIGWRMSRGMDEPDRLTGDDAQARLPGLVTRDAGGGWSVGAPVPRPMENPALAPRTGAFNLGVDLLSGQF